MKKSALAFFMAMVMILSLMPVSAFAEEIAEEETIIETSESAVSENVPETAESEKEEPVSEAEEAEEEPPAADIEEPETVTLTQIFEDEITVEAIDAPAGAVLTVEAPHFQDYDAAISAIAGQNYSEAMALDISVKNADGSQLAEEVAITVKYDNFRYLTESGILYHVKNGEAERVQYTLNAATATITFRAKDFSPFLLILPADDGDFPDGGAAPHGDTDPIDMEDFITSITFQRRGPGEELWKPISDNTVGVGDELRIQLFFELPANTLSSDNKVISYQMDPSIKVLEDVSGSVLGSDGRPAGTYSITKDGLITVVFNDDYVKKNADGAKVDGFVTFYSSVEAMGGSDDDSITFPFKDIVTINVKNPEGDLSVEKASSNVRTTEGTLDYEIVVSSENGTADPVVLTDVLTNAVVDGTVSITDTDGNPVAYEGMWPNITLPQMNGGDQYKITYSAKLDSAHPLPNAQTVMNTVTVSSTDTLGDTLFDDDIQEDKFYSSSITKTGYYDSAKEKIDWTVTINSNSARRGDLSGWTLTDNYGGQPLNPDIDVTISPNPATGSSGSSIVVHLPYTFPEGTASDKTYTVTYSTNGTSKDKNEAILMPPDGGQGTGTGLVGPYSLDISKTPAGVFPVGNNEDGDVIAREDWIMTVDTTNGAVHADRTNWVGGVIKPYMQTEAFPNGGYWMVQDRLFSSQDTYNTPEQQIENAERIVAEILSAGYEGNFYVFSGVGDMSASHTLLYRTPGGAATWDYMMDNPMGVGHHTMTIIFDSDYGPGKMMTLHYSNFLNAKSGTTQVDGHNFFGIYDGNSSLEKGAQQFYYPTVTKVDTRKTAGGQVTEHNYEDLFITQGWTDLYDANTLQWNVNVYFQDREYTEPVIISDTLPEGTVLYTDGKNTTATLNVRNDTGYIFHSGFWLAAVDSSYEATNPSFGTAKSSISGGNGSIENRGLKINYTISQDLKTISFIVPPETANAFRGRTLTINHLEAKITSADWDGIYHSFKNNVTVSEGDTELGTASQTQKVKHELIDKASAGVKDGNTVPYTITLNPNAKDLDVASDMLTVYDMLSYTPPTGTLMNASLTNLKVKNVDTGEDITSQCSYTVENATKAGKNDYLATFIIPDGVHLEISYEYRFSGKGRITDLSNTAYVEGSTGDTDDDDVQMNILIQDADAGAVVVGVNVYKVDSGNYSVHLGGAKFTLEKWTENGWVKVSPADGFVTDNDTGMFNTGELENNVAYRLTETEPPVGYEMRTADVYDFYVPDFSKNNGNLTLVPPDTEKYTVKPLNNGDNLNIANDKIKTGELTVSKTVDGTGADTTKAFHFTVTLFDDIGNRATVSGTYGDMTFADGVAVFDLKGGETKTATGLPHGTAYTVEEADYSNDGYETAATGETGKIQTGTPAAAVFTNTRNLYGDLAITKHVHGNSADKALEFNFTVTLEDTSISGTYGDLTFKDGVAEFTLKDGETKEAPGLPYNIKYTVTEQDYSEEGYVTTKTGDSGTVHPDMPAAVFTNTRDTFGSLSVTKHVAGNNADTDKAFHFTVLLSDPTINNTHGDMTFVNGKAEFDLKDGETKTADGLPNGIEYTVAEADYANAGYVTEKTGNSGIIDSENPAAAVFTNTRDTFGELSVTKHVAGNAASIDKEFSFTVTLTDTTVNGTKGEMTFENGVATFDLKDGETKTATGLPHGTTYTVTEESYANDGYTTEKTGDSGKIQTGTPAKAEFTNTRNTYGDLSVTKKVAGNAADKEKEFSFTVTLGDTNINGKKGDMTFENGVATFTLKDGETKKATGLPNGVSYTVAENDYRKDGYSTAGTNASGNIAENTEIASVFTNTRNANGSLSITKTLAGNGTDADRAFKFTITMDDDSIDGAYSGVTFTKGVAEIQLKGGETKVIEGLPNGAGYTVAEEDCSADGYTTTKTGETGKISEKAAAIVSFTNKREVGKLTVSKSIKGNAADLDQEFKFTVILYYKDKPVSGTFSDVEFNENGIGSFYLTNRESKTIEGLLHGTTFTVVEDRGDYTNNLPEGGAKGTIDKDTPATVSCVNTLDTYGDLVVTKTVAGNSGNTNKAFSFMVTLDDRSINGTYGDMTFTNGIAAFTLKDGQSKTAKDLPNGVSYTVTEEDYSGSGYVTTKGGETGTIVGGKTCEADFTNTKDLFGKLTVTKTVAGNAASKTKAFTFTVELSDTSINGTYGDMTFKKGVATFTLKHNESKTAKKLPAGIEYTVTESRYSGYKVTKTGSTGTIKGNATRTAAFTNTRNNFGYGVIPKTGDTNSILPWILLILAAAAVMVITVFTGKRRRHSGKYSR